MKILAVTQARVGSTRLPNKVLRRIDDTTLLQIHLERLSHSKRITKLYVATTEEPGAKEICAIAEKLGVAVFRGALNDVLDRYYNAVKGEEPDYVVRVTADCPLIDSHVVDSIIDYALANKLDYASNTVERTFPDGIDIEVFTFATLKRAWQEAFLSSDREHVTPYIWRNSNLKGNSLFTAGSFFNEEDASMFRLTVDELVDLELIELLIRAIGANASWKVYINYLKENPELRNINKHLTCNEGYLQSLKQDKPIA